MIGKTSNSEPCCVSIVPNECDDGLHLIVFNGGIQKRIYIFKKEESRKGNKQKEKKPETTN